MLLMGLDFLSHRAVPPKQNLKISLLVCSMTTPLNVNPNKTLVSFRTGESTCPLQMEIQIEQSPLLSRIRVD